MTKLKVLIFGVNGYGLKAATYLMMINTRYLVL